MSAFVRNYPFMIAAVDNIVDSAGLSEASAARIRKLLPSFLLKQNSCLRPEPGLLDPQGSQPAKRFLLVPKLLTGVAAQLKGLVAIERRARSGRDTPSVRMARSIVDSLPKAGIDDLFRQIARWREQDRKDRKSAADTRECVSPATFSHGDFTFSRITSPRDLRSAGARLDVCLAQSGFASKYAGELRRRETDFWMFGRAGETAPAGVLSVDVEKSAVTEAVTKRNGSLAPAMARPIHGFCKAHGFHGECDALADLGLLGDHARRRHHRLARGAWNRCPYFVTQAGEQLRVRLRHGGNTYYAYYDTVRGECLDYLCGLQELCHADAVRVLLHAVSNADAPAETLRMAAGRISERGQPRFMARRRARAGGIHALDDEEAPEAEPEDWED